jgi:hypothetical protein
LWGKNGLFAQGGRHFVTNFHQILTTEGEQQEAECL